jgi:hypothetical protein
VQLIQTWPSKPRQGRVLLIEMEMEMEMEMQNMSYRKRCIVQKRRIERLLAQR